MSTISIRALLAAPELRKDQSFNSLFAAYANTRRKPCGKCRRKPSMITCRTLLQSLLIRKRQLILDTFGLAADAELAVLSSADTFGIRVK